MNESRKFITSGLGFTFAIVGTTGVIFKLFFKNKLLESIHGWFGLAVVVIAIIHILQNWGSLFRHLRKPRVYLLLIPIALAVALISTGHRQEKRTINSRVVMSKLANANAADLARVFGKSADQVFAKMAKDGLVVSEANPSIEDLAQCNQQPPEAILRYFIE
jgi:hypothetical protein